MIFVVVLIYKMPSYTAIFEFVDAPIIGHIFNAAVVINNYQPSYNQIVKL